MIRLNCIAACRRIDEALGQAQITRHQARPNPDARFAPFRISPEPFQLTPQQAAEIKYMGTQLYSFYRAMDALYYLSREGEAPPFIAHYLDAGKPGWLIELAQLKAFRGQTPLIMRPDLLLTPQGWRAAELDSVPGSMGLLAFFEQIYADWPLLGAAATASSMAAALLTLTNDNGQIAIVISQECGGYHAETAWLSRQWREQGYNIPTLDPEQLQITNGQVRWLGHRLHVIYRFFELFDLDNVPGAKDLLYLAAQEKIKITPPPKPHLEEKMWFAFLHHPDLQPYWQQLLGDETLAYLQQLLPPTWLLCRDAVAFAGGPCGSLAGLKRTSRRQRSFVLKPSGFSPLAWGGHGYSRGKDYTTGRWAQAIDRYVAQSHVQPYIIQKYQSSEPLTVRHYDASNNNIATFQGKMRLCPYYFLIGEQVRLSGALATVVPLSKPVIHGMTEAVMMPTAVSAEA